MLRHQLSVLRRQVARPRYSPTDRALLATLATMLPRDRWSAFMVTPSTLLRWLVARHWTHRHRTSTRRLDTELVKLVLRMAKENPRWGYLRIVGECSKLGVQISATSLRSILRSHRVGPAPSRSGPSWA